MEYVLKTNSLCKNYGHFKALNGLSMNVTKGSIYGLIGKNGAGKTTLIRLICGLQEPTSGDYVLYGKKHIDKDITKSRRRMGAIVETPSIYVDLTAYENLKEQYKVLGIPSDDGISEILKLVGLENTGNKKAKNFSLGMRQRLGIAVALAGSPDFLVLDEPVNGLDPQGIIEIRELILKLNQEHGITVLISSHILDELSKLATYYGFIDNGKMIKQISSIELESKCRKCTHLKVSSTKTLAYVLDTMNIEYKILSNTEADIFEKVNISKLTTELSKKDCEVISIHELGRVEISRNKDRFCFVVPEEGAEYVHEKRSGNSFIKKLVALLQTHPCTIEDIHKLFLGTGEKIHFEKIETEDFDYLIYFESGEDSYYYCFKDEGCHIIYHRFMPEDYRDLFSDNIE